MEEVSGRAGGAKCGCNLAADKAGLADSRDDGAMARANGLGEQLGDAVKGLAQGAIEALGEEFKRSRFNTDKLSGVGDVVRHGPKEDGSSKR